MNVDELILRIHSAALSQDGWDVIVSDLCRSLGATGASLVRPTASASIKPSATLYEFDAAAIKAYADHWGQHDAWYLGAVRNGRIGIGQVNLDSQLIERREFERSPFFNEYLKPMDIHRMMNVCLMEPSGGYGPVALSFYRGLGKEAFSASQAGLLSRLAPHLAVATGNYWMAESLRLLGNSYRNAVDAVSSAVFGITSSARVVFMNSAGDELARQQRWIQVDDGAIRPAKGIIEATSFGNALAQISKGISFQIVVTEAITGDQAIINGSPIAPARTNPHPVSADALLWVTSVVPTVDVAADLATLFGLTHAERRLVRRLIAGDELREAATSLGISPHTARAQLKAIFGKTGRRSQGALLALATRLASLRTSAR